MAWVVESNIILVRIHFIIIRVCSNLHIIMKFNYVFVFALEERAFDSYVLLFMLLSGVCSATSLPPSHHCYRNARAQNISSVDFFFLL